MAEVPNKENICAVTHRSHWLVVSLLLGLLSLVIPIGIVTVGLARALIAPGAGLRSIGDYALLGYFIPFLAQCLHGLEVVRRFGRTKREAKIHRLRAVFLGPIGIYLNVREMVLKVRPSSTTEDDTRSPHEG